MLRELHSNQVLSLVRHDEINGERSLEIECTQEFIVGDRIIYQDGSGTWREYVIYGLEQTYRYDTVDVFKYYCVWSVQHDLAGTVVSSMPGVQSPVSASVALDAALAGTHRWTRGTVDVTTTAGASMYMMQGWNAISVLLDTWGGELDSTIEVDSFGVTARKVDLYQHIGSTVATHRFDLGFDIKSVKRVQEDGPLVCRIIPLGKGEQTGDGYGRKITIESVNNNRNYLTYTPMQSAAELPYRIDETTTSVEYPTIIVENPSCETPADLKAWAQEHLAEFCKPKISYVVDVVDATAEGLDIDSLSLGDVVYVADDVLNAKAQLRLEARVVAMEVDELAGKSTSITIGSITENLSNSIGGIESRLSATESAVSNIPTIQCVDVSLGNKTIGSNGYVDITSSVPSDVRQHLYDGGTLVSASVIRWSTSTNAIIPVVYADGSHAYLMGAPNATITNLTIRICYT